LNPDDQPQNATPGPDAERLLGQKVSHDRAAGHDELDRYEIPRFVRESSEPRVREYSLAERITLLAKKGGVERHERVGATIAESVEVVVDPNMEPDQAYLIGMPYEQWKSLQPVGADLSVEVWTAACLRRVSLSLPRMSQEAWELLREYVSESIATGERIWSSARYGPTFRGTGVHELQRELILAECITEVSNPLMRLATSFDADFGVAMLRLTQKGVKHAIWHYPR
jgi:hypothetical protein